MAVVSSGLPEQRTEARLAGQADPIVFCANSGTIPMEALERGWGQRLALAEKGSWESGVSATSPGRS